MIINNVTFAVILVNGIGNHFCMTDYGELLVFDFRKNSTV